MSIFKSKLEKKVDIISKKLETIKINEYVELMNNTKRLLWKNFVIGLAKGLGMSVGFTILGAIALLLFKKLLYLYKWTIFRLPLFRSIDTYQKNESTNGLIHVLKKIVN